MYVKPGTRTKRIVCLCVFADGHKCRKRLGRKHSANSDHHGRDGRGRGVLWLCVYHLDILGECVWLYTNNFFWTSGSSLPTQGGALCLLFAFGPRGLQADRAMAQGSLLIWQLGQGWNGLRGRPWPPSISNSHRCGPPVTTHLPLKAHKAIWSPKWAPKRNSECHACLFVFKF